MAEKSIIDLSNETKACLRNNVMLAGFFVIFMYQLIALVFLIKESTTAYAGFFEIEIACNVAVMVCGVLLALLHKRDLIAMYFILLSSFSMIILYTDAKTAIPVDALCAVVGILFLTVKNEQKWVPGITMLLVSLLAFRTQSWGNTVAIIVSALMCIICFYCVICLGCEKRKLPFYDVLTADEVNASNDGEPVDFHVVGASAGYILFAVIPFVEAIELATKGALVSEYTNEICSIVGLSILMMGVIMLVAGRMKFTPILFWMIGILFFIYPRCGNIDIAWFIGMLMVIAIVLIRNDSRKLVASSLSLYLLGMIFGYVYINNSIAALEYVSIALLALSVIVCLYIAFALHSNGKLKLV